MSHALVWQVSLLRKWVITFIFLIIAGAWTSITPKASIAASDPIAQPARRISGSGWLTLETPHFLVHFPQGQEQAAREMGLIAEETHRYLVPRLKHVPEDKTHVVLADSSDVANASTEVSPYNRIVIHPVFPGNGVYKSGVLLTSMEQWLRVLFTHEYTHLLHLDLHGGAATQVRQLLGRVPNLATPNVFEGFAIIEGYAVHEESTQAGGRGQGSYYDMFLRAAVSQNTVPRWDQILGDYSLSTWYPTHPAYLFGYSFLNYLARMYGEEKLALVHRYHAERPTEGPNKAFETIMQEPFELLWSDWLHDLTQHYQKQIASIGETTAFSPLPMVGQVALWPEWSPDGRRIVYGSTGGVVPSLRILSVDENGLDQPLVNGSIDESNGFSWHPDGNGIAYSKLSVDNSGLLTSDIYTYDLTTKQERRVTTGYRAFAPSISPDGESVAFLARQGRYTKLLVVPWSGGLPRTLWAPAERGIKGSPQDMLSIAWSPQGDKIALSATDGEGRIDLFLFPLKRISQQWVVESAQRITTSDAIEQSPAWSPDERYIFFSSDRGGVSNVHVYDTTGDKFYQVTNVKFGAFAPKVSPVGDTILFTAYDSSGYHLAQMPLRSWEWWRWEPVGQRVAETQTMERALPSLGSIALTPEEVEEAKQTGPESRMVQRRRELAPWELDLMRPLDPESFVVKRYNPLETLTPSYWLPVWGGPNGTWVAGGATGATDALGRHSYSLGVSFGKDDASYAFQYEFSPNLLRAGPVFGARVSGHRQNVVQSSQESSTSTGRVYASWYRLGVLQERGLTLSLNGSSFPEISPELRLSGSWRQLEGDGPLHVQHSLTGSVAKSLVAGFSDAQTFMTWRVKGMVPEKGGFSTKMAAGFSGGAEVFSLGGLKGDFAVRGLPAGALRSDVAAVVSLEGQKLIASVERGWEDWPVFLKDISVSSYFDAGAIKVEGVRFQYKAAVGLEINVSGFVGRGNSKHTLDFGVVRPLDGATPVTLYWSLAKGL